MKGEDVILSLSVLTTVVGTFWVLNKLVKRG